MFNLTPDTWGYLIGGVLLVHGLGHSGGYWFFDRSWLLPAAGDGVLRWACIALWLVAMAGFAGAGAGVLAHKEWWRTLAVTMAVISLPVAVLFLGGTAASNKAACVVVDVAVLVGLLLAHWPSAEVVGS